MTDSFVHLDEPDVIEWDKTFASYFHKNEGFVTLPSNSVVRGDGEPDLDDFLLVPVLETTRRDIICGYPHDRWLAVWWMIARVGTILIGVPLVALGVVAYFNLIEIPFGEIFSIVMISIGSAMLAGLLLFSACWKLKTGLSLQDILLTSGSGLFTDREEDKMISKPLLLSIKVTDDEPIIPESLEVVSYTQVRQIN